MPATELSDRAGTIPYEILTRLGNRVGRVYRGGAGKPMERGFGLVRRFPASDEAPTPR